MPEVRVRRLLVLAVLVAVVLVGALASASTPAATKGRWVIRDLGTLHGGSSTALSLNERGQIVGTSGGHAFLWEKGSMRDLGTLGGKSSSAHDINERGQIVGEVTVRYGTYRAFLWQKGSMHDLGTLRGESSWAYAINDRSQVAGEWRSGCCVDRVFLWQKGKMRDIGTLGGEDAELAYGRSLNNRGWIVGESLVIGTAYDLNERGVVAGTRPGPGGQALPCLWRRGIVLNILLVFGRAVRGPTMSLNDHDQVIGSTFRGGVSGVHGFVWQKGKTTDLPLLPGGKSSKAHAINNKGWIVGTSQTASGVWHAVLWTYKP